MRSREERSDELRELVRGTLASNTDTSVRNVAAANSTAVSNVTKTSFFATRFALRSFFAEYSDPNRDNSQCNDNYLTYSRSFNNSFMGLAAFGQCTSILTGNSSASPVFMQAQCSGGVPYVSMHGYDSACSSSSVVSQEVYSGCIEQDLGFFATPWYNASRSLVLGEEWVDRTYLVNNSKFEDDGLKVRRRLFGIFTFNADTYVRNVAAVNFTAVCV